MVGPSSRPTQLKLQEDKTLAMMHGHSGKQWYRVGDGSEEARKEGQATREQTRSDLLLAFGMAHMRGRTMEKSWMSETTASGS